jgi:hypothetical protein
MSLIILQSLYSACIYESLFCCNWSRNLVNEKAMAHWGLSRQKQKTETAPIIHSYYDAQVYEQ